MEQDMLRYLKATQEHVQHTQVEVNAIIKASHEENVGQLAECSAKQVDLLVQHNEIYNALLDVSESLAQSYAQIREDIQDHNRLSWAGTAHEIRELLATMLRLLAPDGEVITQPWFKQDPNTSGPTQKQRVRHILQECGRGSKERQVVEQVINLEGMVENLVRLTYARASDAAHRFKPRSEVIRILRYFEAFAYDLLNLEG